MTAKASKESWAMAGGPPRAACSKPASQGPPPPAGKCVVPSYWRRWLPAACGRCLVPSGLPPSVVVQRHIGFHALILYRFSPKTIHPKSLRNSGNVLSLILTHESNRSHRRTNTSSTQQYSTSIYPPHGCMHACMRASIQQKEVAGTLRRELPRSNDGLEKLSTEELAVLGLIPS